MILAMFSAYMAYLWIESLLLRHGRFSANVNNLHEGWIEVVLLIFIFIVSISNAVYKE